MAKYEKLLKNKKGEYNYHFNFEGGGFNNVWAKNKKEAIKEIKLQFSKCSLKPSFNSLYRATKKQADEMDKLGWMLTV